MFFAQCNSGLLGVTLCKSQAQRHTKFPQSFTKNPFRILSILHHLRHNFYACVITYMP